VKFALLAYRAPVTWYQLTTEERVAWEADDAAFHVELADRRCVVHAATLDHARTTTVRVCGGETIVADGPFTESPQVLGGYVVIDVADLDAAIDLACRCPSARLGPLEVRPLC
jgi:hypothetical protein